MPDSSPEKSLKDDLQATLEQSIRNGLRAIIEKYQTELAAEQKSCVPITDYTSLRAACEVRDLADSLVILIDFLNNRSLDSLSKLQAGFKFVAEQRRLLTKKTALSFLATPNSSANLLYDEFFFTLLNIAEEDFNLIRYLNFFAPEVDTLLDVQKTARKTNDNNFAPEEFHVQVKIEELKLEEKEQIESLAKLKCAEVIIVDNKILPLPSVARCSSSKKLNLAFIQKIYALLSKQYPAFYEKLLAHNQEIGQVYAYAALFDTRLRDRLTQLIQQLRLMGKRATRNRLAELGATEAVLSFKRYFDTLPPEARAIETTLQYRHSLEYVITTHLLAQGQCIETAADALQSILENPANKQWLDFIPNAQKATLPGKITHLATEGNDHTLALPENYVTETLAKIDLSVSEEAESKPAALGRFLSNFDPHFYPHLLKADNLIAIVREPADLYAVIIHLNLVQLNAALRAWDTGKLRNIIRNGVRLHSDILKHLLAEQQAVMITAIQAQLPTFFQEAWSNLDNHTKMAIQTVVAREINNIDNLKNLLRDWDSSHYKAILALAKPQLLNIIKSSDDCKKIMADLDIKKIEILCEIILEQRLLPSPITTLADLKNLIIRGERKTKDENIKCETFITLAKPQLSNMIKTLYDFIDLMNCIRLSSTMTKMYDAVQEQQLPGTIHTFADLARMLPHLTELSQLAFLSAIKNQLLGIIQTPANLKILLPKLDVEQQVVIAKAIQTKLSAAPNLEDENNKALTAILTITLSNISKDREGLKHLLGSWSEEEYPTLLPLIKVQLLGSIKSVENLERILSNLYIRERRFVLLAIQEQLPEIIKTVDHLNRGLIAAGSSVRNKTIIYEATKAHIPNLINNIANLKALLQHLNAKEKTEVLTAIQEKLSDMINTFDDFLYVHSQATQHLCDEMIISLQKKLPDIIETASQLKKIFMKEPYDYNRTLICNAIRANIPQLIKTIPDLVALATTRLPIGVSEDKEITTAITRSVHSRFYSLIKSKLNLSSFIHECRFVNSAPLQSICEHKTREFALVYSALRDGQSSFLFKTDFSKKIAGKASIDQLEMILEHAKNNPKSRTAEALRIIKTARNTEHLKLLVYKSAFKSSHWFAKSNSLLGNNTCCNFTFFNRSVEKIKAIPENCQPIAGTRYFKICERLKPLL